MHLVKDTTEERLDLARKLIDMTVAKAPVIETVQKTLDIVFPWREGRVNHGIALIKPHIGELCEIIAQVWARHFEVSELQDLIVFYSSPTGQKLLDLQPTIMMESMERGMIWGQQVAMTAFSREDATTN